MLYTPPHKITQKTLSLVAEISEAIAGADLVALTNSPQLRKQNQNN